MRRLKTGKEAAGCGTKLVKIPLPDHSRKKPFHFFWFMVKMRTYDYFWLKNLISNEYKFA